MGASWGVPRSMTAVHALLFIEGAPMTMDQIMARLDISRGNASMTLRTLAEWKLVHREAHDSMRKELFSAQHDTWQLIAAVIRMRRARELDPPAAIVRQCLERLGPPTAHDPAHPAHFDAVRQRLEELSQLIVLADALALTASNLDAEQCQALVAALAKQR